ncbi:MAG TPA: histidine kinase [Kofleriaceae bacterium]|nr:histidine kinase [Kofleriaceae bacterium]
MRLLRDPRFWAGCVAGWALLALAEGTALHIDAVRAGRDSGLGAMLLDRSVSDVIWVGVAAAVFAVMQRVMAATTGRARLVRHAVALGIALAPIYATWGAFARTVVHGGGVTGFAQQVRNTAGATVLWVAFLYSMTALTACAILVAQRARRHERDGAELKVRLAHAELELLRAQLEPHFLFNALNTIAGLIRGARPELATAALAKLSDLLRYVVEASRQDRVPLAWELEFATSYVELQQLRFGPRLQFTIDQAAAGRGCDVPPLLLQPLIENAVVHGVARTRDPATIDVRVAMTDGRLRVAVDNTRGEPDAGGVTTTGVGLRNTRQRLERMYGAEFALDAGPAGPDHYRVTIALPHPPVAA